MEPHLSQLLRNNDSPDDSAIQEVRNLLLAPQCKPDEIKAEIQHCESALEALRTQLSVTQRYMDEYNSILSPIRRLPEDVLLAIFFRCLPAHRNPTMHASEAPVLLINICRRWRSLTLSSPLMWAQLHIEFSEEYQSPEKVESAVTRASVKKPGIHKICDKVNDWISLSGECPLSISIYYEDQLWYPMDDADRKKVDPSRQSISKLFRILAGVAYRWKNIDISGLPYKLYLTLENFIAQSTKELPMLEMLKVSLGDGEVAEHQQAGIVRQQSALKLLNAPNLRSVSLIMPPQWKFVVPPPPSSWKEITYLNIHNLTSTYDLLRILQFCSNLIHCHIFVDDCGESSPASLEGIATLNSLKALVIYESADDELASKFYSLIHAPHLRWIHYEKYIHHSDLPDGATARPPILSLLRQARELKKLTVEPMAFGKADFRYVLEAVPSITHLCVGKETSEFPPRSKTSFTRNPRMPGENQFGQERFSLQLLLANKNRTGTSGNAATDNRNRSGVLSPNLEVFELTENDSAPVPWDEYLQKFISHRMSLYSRKEAAALRHVRVVFERQRQTDIREEVARLAKLAGIDFTLELHYLPRSPSESAQEKSPVLGPIDSDGSTTDFDEIFENYL